MKNINQVSNGVTSHEFPATVIEKMKTLGLIQFRGSSVITRDGQPVRVKRYTAAFDDRKPRGKW
jgi:hypothetical protein